MYVPFHELISNIYSTIIDEAHMSDVTHVTCVYYTYVYTLHELIFNMWYSYTIYK